MIGSGGSALEWARKSGGAILDVALFSGANFVLHILLARWLSPQGYGAFAVAYSVFVLIVAFHQAVLTEPMLVFGAGKYRQDFAGYLGRLVAGHAAAAAVIALLLGLTALGVSTLASRTLAGTLAALALAGPLILLLWIVRRALYVERVPGRAALGSGAYLILLLGSVYVAHRLGMLSGALGVLAMGAAAAVAAFGLLWTLSPRFRGPDRPPVAEVLGDHWRYGRWSAGTAALTWASAGNVFLAVLPLWAGLEGSGALRALMNLALPMLHASSAVAVLLVPGFVESFRKRPGRFGHRVGRLVALFAAAALLYWGVLTVIGDELLVWLFGAEYAPYAGLVVWIGGLPLVEGMAMVLASALRAQERPDAVFWSYAVSAVITVTVGLMLVIGLGVRGAVLGLLLSNLTLLVVSAALFVRDRRAGRMPVPADLPEVVR